jgi:hypothetical protein
MGATSVHHPDGTTWLLTLSGGRTRLLVVAPGQAAIPFLDTTEETGRPMALIGTDRIAFGIGSGDAKRIAIASVRDGRILRRLDQFPARAMTAMAASHDGQTLYVVESGQIWSLPVSGGERRRIHAGDGVAVAANGTSLLVQVLESSRVRWIRTGLDGTTEEPIRVQGDWRFARNPISPGAVGPGGRMVLPITVKGSWFWTAAVFDPETGEVRRVPLPLRADVPSPAWTADGRIIAATYSVRSSLWRFRPTPSLPNGLRR